ncbi:MAG: pilus assembly protein [Chloroflexi bacterium OHK40]
MQPSARRERGQALVEFMFVLGLLLTLILGLICVGQVLLANYTVSQAARAAAHQAAIAGGESEVALSTARDVIDSGVGTSADQAEVTVACPDPCRRYAPVTVSVAYTGGFWTPLPPIFTEFTVRASATRAAERDSQP